VHYRILADAVLLAHGAFIVFVVLGALFALRWPGALWLHAPAALWGAWVELAGRVCPLTPLENHFRRLGGLQGYEEGFIERYLVPLIYPGALTREVQFALGVLVLAINAGVYAWVLHRRKGKGGTAHQREG
jgi:hypothetical protein